MMCWACGRTDGASVAPSGTAMVHGDEASTKKNSAPVSRTARSTSDSASRSIDPHGVDSGASALDVRADEVGSSDATARNPDVRSWRPATAQSYTRHTLERGGRMGATETFRIPVAVAETYESKFVPALFAEWAPHLVNAAGVAPGQAVLDVACGTGIVARTAADLMGN